MAKKVTKKTEGTQKKATKAKRPATRTKPATRVASVKAAPDLDEIRARAYEIYASGRNPGDPVADWFQAERELQNASA
jgi:CelD/BcsL family acetyltransferase involved in cellulose biosynthesis